MTPKAKARHNLFNYNAGIAHGSEVARSIINRYPDGFDDAKCATLANEVKQKEAAALAVIPKRFRDAFSAGLHVGRRSTISKYRETLILRTCKGLQPN